MSGPCCRAHIYRVLGKHAKRRDPFPQYGGLDGSCRSGSRPQGAKAIERQIPGSADGVSRCRNGYDPAHVGRRACGYELSDARAGSRAVLYISGISSTCSRESLAKARGTSLHPPTAPIPTTGSRDSRPINTLAISMTVTRGGRNRQTAMLARPRPGPAGARGTPGRALGRCGKHAKRRDPFPKYGGLDGSCRSGPRKAQRRKFVLAAGRSAGRLLVPFFAFFLERLRAALLAHRSQRSQRGITGRRRAAPAAQTGGPPRGILFPLPVTPCHVARFAHRAAFNGWMCATARARASVPPCPIAPPAPVTCKRAAPFRVSAAVKFASRLGLRASCALGLATLFAAMPAQGPIGRGPRLPAPRTHAAGDPVGGNAFIPPPPACTFLLGIFVWHVPPFRGCGPGEGHPADLWHLWPAGHPRGQAV